MKKLLSILLVFLSIASYAQVDTALGLKGKKIPLASLNVPSTYLITPNSTTLIFDSSKVGVSLQKNATRDSIRLISGSGSILATVKDSTGGGAATVDTTLVKVTNNNLGVTRDFTKGLMLRNYTTATLGNQQISPMALFGGNSFGTTGSASIPVYDLIDFLPVQGSTTGLGYLRFNHLVQGGSVVNNVLTIGTANASVTTPTVGINALPFTSGGASLNIGGSMELSGNISGSSATFNINSFGSSFIDMNSMYLRLVSGAYYGVVSDKPHALGKLTAPTGGMELDVTSTGRALGIPRMTTAQRDAINLTVSSVTVTNGGTGYTSTPTVTYTAGPTPTAVTTAVTTVVTRVGNVITAIAVANAGSYNSTPTITITGGGGTGATATANMTQVLTAGMVIYNTTTAREEYWDGANWAYSPKVVTTGSAQTSGFATLAAGTVTVNTTAALTGSNIQLTYKTISGTASILSYTIVNATSFTINSLSPTDASLIGWVIINP